MNWILFGLYITLVLGIFIFVAIILIHIGEFRKYSLSIGPITRIYLILIIIITVFGSYMVLTNNIKPSSLDGYSPNMNLEF